MKIKSLEMQKKFACLYPLGTLMDVTVLSFSWQNHIWVKSTGGCRGILCEQFNFPQGTEISAVVTGIRDGIPVFSPTPEWCLAHAPKKARVLFITPIGVALKTEDDIFVLYAPKEGLPQKLHNLQPKDVVEVKGLSQDSARMFIASELSVPDTQKELDFKDAWTEETIKSVMAQGSQRCWRGAKLGNICYATPVSPFRAKMRDNTMLALKDSQFPPDAEEVLVRIVYINENNDVLCEFINTVH